MFNVKQESRAVARKPRDAAAVLFGLKLKLFATPLPALLCWSHADCLHYAYDQRRSAGSGVVNSDPQNNLRHRAVSLRQYDFLVANVTMP